MRALYTAIIYFGAFIVIGGAVKFVIVRWMARHGASLEDVNEQAGASAGKGRRFLLGSWRNED